LDLGINQYLGIRECEGLLPGNLDFAYTVKLTGHREVLRMAGGMGIDEQTCSFEE
jgi:hypothetical protein